MGNDLLSGFSGTQNVCIETEVFPQGCSLKERLWLPNPQCFVQQLNGR
jgi:hypothetical protein